MVLKSQFKSQGTVTLYHLMVKIMQLPLSDSITPGWGKNVAHANPPTPKKDSEGKTENREEDEQQLKKHDFYTLKHLF